MNVPVPTVADVGERALVARIRERVPAFPDWVTVGIGDDAAVLEPGRNTLEVITTDALVEGVHFDRAFVPPRAIGHRALAANLSDLAAMGARPRAALLSLALPDALPLETFDGLIDGLLDLAARSRIALVGGNIARSPGPLMVDITATGTVGRRQVLRRSGARAGDAMYVSGAIGDAAAGLEWCRAHGLPATTGPDAGDEPFRDAVARFLYPEPRLRLGWMLGRNRAVTSCVDLSDGFADAVHQIASASGLGAILDGALVPVAPGARHWFERNGRDPLMAALAGGEDYELLFTVPARRHRLLQALARRVPGLPLTRVGVMTRECAVVLRRDGRQDDLPAGFAHFR
jgi:thiamine-monophosphate kinase